MKRGYDAAHSGGGKRPLPLRSAMLRAPLVVLVLHFNSAAQTASVGGRLGYFAQLR